MKKSALALILAVLMAVGLLTIGAAADGPDGSENNPFTTVEQYNEAIKNGDLDGEDVYLTVTGENFTESNPFNLTNVQSRENPPKLHLTITKCTFTGNTAKDSKNPSFMYLSNCKELVIDDCEFDSGTGLKYGINWNLVQITGATVEIKNSTFNGDYSENAIKLNQRNGAGDKATDIKPSTWENDPIAASIASAVIDNVTINSTVPVILLGSAGKGDDGAAAPSTGAFPVTISNCKGSDGKDVNVFLAYNASKTEAETLMGAMANPEEASPEALALAAKLVVPVDDTTTVYKTANGDLASEEDFVAEVNDDKYTSLESAIEAAQDGQTVTLLKDVTLTEPVVINTGIKLDLGGKTVTIAKNDTPDAGNSGIKFTSGSNKLTNGIIIDERSKDNTTYSWVAVAVQAPATLATDNVTIASYIPNNDAGYNYPLRALNTDDVGGVSLTLNSGTKITEYNQAVTDEGGTYGTCGVTVFGANKVEDPAVLVINDGVEITSTSLAVAGNGSSDGTVFTINGGKLTSTNATAVYVPQICDFSVHGGTITGVAGGVQFCGSGSVTINGGTLIATGPYSEFPDKPSSQSDGSADDGAALSIVSRGGGYQAEGAKIYVNITGGEFISENNAAISVYRLQQVNNEWITNESTNVASYVGKLNVDGGIFEGGKKKGAFEVDDKAVDAVTVSKGSFNSPVPDELLADGLDYQLKSSDGMFSYYETLDAALEAAAGDNGAVITYVGGETDVQSYTVNIVYGNGTENFVQTWPAGNYTLPTAPSKPGYIFLGWRCGNDTYGAGDSFTLNADMTFTAIWANMPDITPGTPGTPDDDDEPVVTFPFTDVREGQWFYEAVKYVYDEGIMNGMDRYTFDPNGSLTRAMVWTMLARHEGVDTEGGANWYAKAQEWAVEAGVSDGTDPMGNITREQLVTMLWRLNGSETVTGSLTGFTDYDKVSDWAGNAMLWATVNGIIEGDEANALNPTAGCTRAQAAAMIMRFCEYHEGTSFGTVV